MIWNEWEKEELPVTSKGEEVLDIHIVCLYRLKQWVQHILSFCSTVIEDVISAQSFRNVALNRLTKTYCTFLRSSFTMSPSSYPSPNRAMYWSTTDLRSPSQLGRFKKTWTTLSLKVSLLFSSSFEMILNCWGLESLCFPLILKNSFLLESSCPTLFSHCPPYPIS